MGLVGNGRWTETTKSVTAATIPPQKGERKSQRYATNEATNGIVPKSAPANPHRNQKGKRKRQRYATNEPPIVSPQPVRPWVTNKRIEIKAVPLQNGVTGLYWRWRWAEVDGQRRSSYGGKIDTLNNQERLTQYRRNRRRYQKRKEQDE